MTWEPIRNGFQVQADFVHQEEQHRRRIASVVKSLGGGKMEVSGRLTLAASAANTTITDARIGVNSVLIFMPETANAAAEIGAGTLYVSATGRVNGSAVVTHANNSQTDRSFLVAIIG